LAVGLRIPQRRAKSAPANVLQGMCFILARGCGRLAARNWGTFRILNR
jgi:hypothetical protein